VSTADVGLAALAALTEPTRGRIYRHVAAQKVAQSRDAVAVSLGVARSVAAFHLEKLADVGLLEYEFRRPLGRTGPGAGRPAKLYRRSSVEIGLTVPERHYDLAAHLLAKAVEDATSGPMPVVEALRSAAREHGRCIGARRPPPKKPSRRQLLQHCAEVLADQGYEPGVEGSAITLRNCPFHALTEEHRQLVCGMNLELIRGVLEGCGLPEATARLDPAPGRCCASLQP
jgi:predicted ArsR family transcriptional regulator